LRKVVKNVLDWVNGSLNPERMEMTKFLSVYYGNEECAELLYPLSNHKDVAQRLSRATLFDKDACLERWNRLEAEQQKRVLTHATSPLGSAPHKRKM